MSCSMSFYFYYAAAQMIYSGTDKFDENNFDLISFRMPG